MSRRWAVPAAALAVLGLHTALVLHFEPPAVILGPDPVAGFDFDTHYEQTLRAVEAWRHSGRMWSYDPHLLAGMPSGTIFDADNKLIEVVAVAGAALGIPPHRSFNLFIWFLHLILPLVVLASARLFDLDRRAAVLAAALASAVWFFDSLAHWCFYVGMIAWGSAAYLWLLPLGLFHRWLRTRRPVLLLGLLAMLSLLHMHHPYVFFVLAVPLGVMYLRAARGLGRWEHAALAGVAVGTLTANLWWIETAVRHWHYILDSGFYMDATPDFLLTDWLGLLQEPDVAGVIGLRTGFRFLALGGAVLGLWVWRRRGDTRFLPVTAALGALLFTAYFGRWVAPLQQVQPYRFVLPAVYLAVLPAAAWLVEAVGEFRRRRETPWVWGLAALLLFTAAPRLIRDVLYFFPEAVPRPSRPLPAPPPEVSGGPAFGAILWPRHFDFRDRPLTVDEKGILRMVRTLDDGTGRWLVEWWELGERLAWATRAQVLGGFREINLAHSDANLFRVQPEGDFPDPDGLRRYFERYNVRWVVMFTSKPRLEGRTDLLDYLGIVHGFRIYRTRIASSWFLDGGPGEVRAELDRLSVRGSTGPERVLKYHWHEGLRCRPGCEAYRVEVEGDRVGFVGVRNAPAEFEIVNLGF